MWYDGGGDKKVVKRKRKLGRTWLSGILMHIQKDLQVHGYRCSFHPGVFQGIDFHGEHEMC
jgi:hypothetical protein